MNSAIKTDQLEKKEYLSTNTHNNCFIQLGAVKKRVCNVLEMVEAQKHTTCWSVGRHEEKECRWNYDVFPDYLFSDM
jgi:hypothetical protein